MNYLNEWYPFAAQWCRNLAEAGEIPDCVVDETDIRLVTGDRLSEYKQCHFFAGIGGWPLAFQLAGIPSDQPAWSGSAPPAARGTARAPAAPAPSPRETPRAPLSPRPPPPNESSIPQGTDTPAAPRPSQQNDESPSHPKTLSPSNDPHPSPCRDTALDTPSIHAPYPTPEPVPRTPSDSTTHHQLYAAISNPPSPTSSQSVASPTYSKNQRCVQEESHEERHPGRSATPRGGPGPHPSK